MLLYILKHRNPLFEIIMLQTLPCNNENKCLQDIYFTFFLLNTNKLYSFRQ